MTAATRVGTARPVCPRCHRFADVLPIGAPEHPGAPPTPVGHCRHRPCRAWFSLPTPTPEGPS